MNLVFLIFSLYFIMKISLCEEECQSEIITTSRKHNIIVSVNDSDGRSARYACPTLQSALNLRFLKNKRYNVSILIPTRPREHIIVERVEIIARSVSFIGNGGTPPVIKCADKSVSTLNYIILFHSCASVELFYLWMQQCSCPIGIHSVSQVHINAIRIRNFSNASLEIYNCKDVYIYKSKFIDNSGNGTSHEARFRGNTGAVSIGYYKYSSSMQQCTVEQNITVTVIYTVFKNNHANARGENYRTTSHAFFNGILTGRAGGLGVFINEDKCHAIITVANCTFERNFAQSYGGGLYFVYSGSRKAVRNKIVDGRHSQFRGYVYNSTFIGNRAGYGAGGFITTIETAGPKNFPHLVEIDQCNFNENLANYAGAYFHHVVFQGGLGNSLRITNTGFTNNSGNFSPTGFGSALVASAYNDFNSTEGFPVHSLENCSFVSNFGSSTVVTLGYIPFSFYEENVFSNNNGTALMVVGTQLTLRGRVNFTNNIGLGALRLVSFAQVKLIANVAILFNENKGRTGAAMVVDSFNQAKVFRHLSDNPQCFLLSGNYKKHWSKEDNISLIFENNNASFGSAMYIQSNLSQCSCYNVSYYNMSQFPHWVIFKIRNNTNTGVINDTNNQNYAIVTDAKSLQTNLIDTVSVSAWPGKKIQMDINSNDQLGTATGGTSISLIDHSRDDQFHMIPNVFFKDKEPFHAHFTFSVSNKTKYTNHTISIQPLQSATLYNAKAYEVNFTLRSSACPAGYILSLVAESEGQIQCVCGTKQKEILHCKEDMIIIKSGLWATSSSESDTLQFIHCPPGYCQCFATSDTIGYCAYIEGHPNEQCTSGRKAVVFIIIIMIIVLCDRPLPSLIHPLLLYVQIFPLVTFYFHKGFSQFLFFVSSLLGFYLPYDFCLEGNIDGLIPHSLRLFLPILTVIIAFTLSFILKFTVPILVKSFCRSCQRNLAVTTLRMHGVHIVLLLVFPNTFYNALRSLYCPSIITESGHNSHWYINGSIQCFQNFHWYIVLLSAATLLTFLSPIIFAVLKQKVKLPVRIIKRWMEKCVEAFEYHYKPEYSYWWVLDIMSKMLLILLIVVLPQNKQSLILGLYGIIGISSYCSPYRNKWTNYILTGVLSLCAFLLSLELSWIATGDLYILKLSVLIITYYSPMVLLMATVIWNLCLKVHHSKWFCTFSKHYIKQEEEYFRQIHVINE